MAPAVSAPRSGTDLQDSNFYELWCHLEEEGWTFNFTTGSDKHVHQHREAYDPAGSPPCKHVWVNPHGARRKHYLLALALGQFVVPHGLSDRSYKSLIIGKKAPTVGKRKKNEFLLMGSGLAEPLRKTPKSSRGGRGGRRVRHHGRARGRGRGRIGAGGGVAGAHDSGSEEADGEVGEHEEGDRPESDHSQASLGEIESIVGGVHESMLDYHALSPAYHRSRDISGAHGCGIQNTLHKGLLFTSSQHNSRGQHGNNIEYKLKVCISAFSFSFA